MITGLGRSPGEGERLPTSVFWPENSMDCIVHGVTKSWTQLSNFHFHLSNEQKLDVKLLQFLNKIYLRMQKPLPLEDKYAKSLQSCLTLCQPIDGSPPGSPIHGILQARVLECVAIMGVHKFFYLKNVSFFFKISK